MGNRITILTIAMGAAIAMPAQACFLVPPPVSETINKVAERGVLISGQVVQAFDPDKNQPEIIRADKIFVGEGGAERFRDLPISDIFRTS